MIQASTIIKELASQRLFSSLSSDHLSELISLGQSREFPSGEIITLYGSVWPYLFFIEDGLIEAIKESPEGRSLVMLELTKGMVFWGMGFFKEGLEMPVALKAKQKSRIFLWPREKLLPFLADNGKFSWELTELMAERMMRASEIVGELAFQPIAARLARYLLNEFSERTEEVITRELTLDEIAARIGSTREMVCRQLYRLADRGIIQISRTEWTVSDLNLLQDIADSYKGETH